MPSQQRITTSPQKVQANPVVSSPSAASRRVSGSLDEVVAGGGHLSPGMSGPAVVELQKLLGLSEGGQTGTFGPTTQKALLNFQKENGVQATGEVGETTLKALRAAGGANAVLFRHQGTGASDETTRGQGASGRGIAASQQMAGEDRQRLLQYKQNFLTVARKHKLPPALLAAIASRETRGGTQLRADGYSMWDGDGFGLMQVDRNFHRPKGGPGDVDHIDQAATILGDFYAQAKAYFPTWSADRQLQIAVAAYNRGPSAFDHPQDYDGKTTGHDYSNDIWVRARALAKDFGGDGLPPASPGTAAKPAPQESTKEEPVATTKEEPAAKSEDPLAKYMAAGKVLRQGDHGPEVLSLQKLLGMYGGGLSSVFGPTTAEEVRSFQQDHGLQVDGDVGPETYARLAGRSGGASSSAAAGVVAKPAVVSPAPAGGNEPVKGTTTAPKSGSLAEAIRGGRIFQRGDKGPEVLEIQELLGFGTGGKTGEYGPSTEEAVKTFQSLHQIQANGRVGPDTYRALTAPKSRAPLIDQHRMDHERSGAFCGIATLLMTLQANGKNVNPQSRGQLDSFAQGIYTPGAGSSGAGMASRMRDYGLKDAAFTTGGNISGLVSALAKGRTVPMGVVSLSGTVVEMKKPSARYPDLRVGDHHAHRFGASGHWVAVVGFEGDPRRPTWFYVNDPDTGARLKLSKTELEESAAAGEGIWMITY